MTINLPITQVVHIDEHDTVCSFRIFRRRLSVRFAKVVKIPKGCEDFEKFEGFDEFEKVRRIGNFRNSAVLGDFEF